MAWGPLPTDPVPLLASQPLGLMPKETLGHPWPPSVLLLFRNVLAHLSEEAPGPVARIVLADGDQRAHLSSALPTTHYRSFNHWGKWEKPLGQAGNGTRAATDELTWGAVCGVHRQGAGFSSGPNSLWSCMGHRSRPPPSSPPPLDWMGEHGSL